jgi:hypothetical protein
MSSYLKEIVAAPAWKVENTAEGIRCADHAIPFIREVGNNFADQTLVGEVTRSV